MTAVGSSDGRIAYLDYVRGVAMLLVVFCHYPLLGNGGVAGNVVMCIAWGAVPCFFLVSGGLQHQKKEFHWKKYWMRLLQLYLALCAWKLIYLLVTCLYADVGFSVAQLVTYLFLFGSLDGVASGLMWFVQAYLLVMLFYPISWFLFRHFSEGKKILIFLIGILFAAGPVVHDLNFVLQIFSEKTGRNLLSFSPITSVAPFSAYENALLFFLLGALLLHYRERIKDFFQAKARRIWIPIACLVIGTIGLMLIRFQQMGSFRWEGTYLSSGYQWISTLPIAIGIYLLVQNYMGGIRVRWLTCLGKNTMGIYYLHFTLLAFLAQTAIWSNWTSYGSIILNLVKTGIITVVCLLVTIGLRKIPVIKLLVS